MSERGAERTSVCGQCGSCFCECKLIIDELLLKGKRLVMFYSFETIKTNVLDCLTKLLSLSSKTLLLNVHFMYHKLVVSGVVKRQLT